MEKIVTLVSIPIIPIILTLKTSKNEKSCFYVSKGCVSIMFFFYLPIYFYFRKFQRLNTINRCFNVCAIITITILEYNSTLDRDKRSYYFQKFYYFCVIMTYGIHQSIARSRFFRQLWNDKLSKNRQSTYLFPPSLDLSIVCLLLNIYMLELLSIYLICL